MKTPLTAILSSAVFLRDYKGNSGEREEMIGSIVRSAEAMHERLEDLFRVIGLEGDQPPLRYTPTDARRLADEGLRLSGASSVRVKLKDAPKNLRVDPERLSRAVSNLLENAVKFSPQGSPVELRIREIDEERAGRSGPGVSISVLDRGPGVAAEDRERIFSPFEQGGDPLTAKPSGIGIGLYEARAIAQQHGGTLKYRPRKGGGSEFRIEIPTQPCEAEPSMESVGA
jgi:signal transduction histidine kinase